MKVAIYLVDKLMGCTKTLDAMGIRIFAFRPPIRSVMVALEEKLSGYDEKTFLKRFREAGSVWLSFPFERCHSYDGSRLHKKIRHYLFKGPGREDQTFFGRPFGFRCDIKTAMSMMS